MPNWYSNRVSLKRALGIDASATGRDADLDTVLEDVSRSFDQYVGFHIYPSSATLDFTALHSTGLNLDTPLLNVDAVRTDSSGNASYGTTMATTDYYLAPYNATAQDPPQPWWSLELQHNATTVFPKGIKRGVRILGTWGYYDDRATSTATLATDITAAATSIQINGATSLYPGNTIRIGSERIFVKRTPATSTGSHTSGISVERGRNGSVAATHSSGDAIQVYRYPVIERAALYQAELDWKLQDAPLGQSGGDPFGGQQAVTPDGLHWATRRTLDRVFRTPTAR